MYRSTKGFSLIELMVVLLLVSLATGLVLPNLANLYRSAQLNSELSRLSISISSLGYLSFSSGEAISVATDADIRKYIGTSDSWQLSVEEPLRINASGVCLGGLMRFESDEVFKTLRIQAPFCRIIDETI